jgi:rare lipoprotein A
MQTALTAAGGIARGCALLVCCLVLAHCSGPFTGESRYSKRVVEEGEPVPKGGGSYRVGRPYIMNGRVYVPHENPAYRADGLASWYGRDFHGRLTANGEVYDMHGISAAHPTLPIPSYARVTNLDNGRSIVVRINDRGPYTRARLIDLSIGTAKALRFYDRGVARVRVEYIARAPLEGSDDRMLLATLRDGSPAPAPSKVMVAAAKPFIRDEGANSARPLPAERPMPAARLPSSRVALEASASDRSTLPGAPSPSRAASAADSGVQAAAPSTSPMVSFGPATGSPLGLMSGRGLY